MRVYDYADRRLPLRPDFYTTLQENPPEFMMEGDITTRLGSGGQRHLDPLAPVEVKKFLGDLLSAFVDRDCADKKIESDGLGTTAQVYPFTEDGFNAFVDQAGTAQEHAIPRTIIRALTACALEALATDALVFDADLVERVVPQEFAEMA